MKPKPSAPTRGEQQFAEALAALGDTITDIEHEQERREHEQERRLAAKLARTSG